LIAIAKKRDRLCIMTEQTDLSYMASLYMALADPTRLRLLLQMYSGEVCVGEFADALGDSQPKISRHLAYLRNAGVVNTRRDGKWIHYSIRWPEDDRGTAVFRAALDWLAKGRNDSSAGQIRSVGQPQTAKSTMAPDTYDDANMCDEMSDNNSEISAHNELEEFLL
jgi:DNA-binding transcriptional ArsR family regulator